MEQTPQPRHLEILDLLTKAFAGVHTVPLETLGEALAQNISKNELKFGTAELVELGKRINEFNNPHFDLFHACRKIVTGMEKFAQRLRLPDGHAVWVCLIELAEDPRFV